MSRARRDDGATGLRAGITGALRNELGGAFVQRVDAGDALLLLELRSPGRSARLGLSVRDDAPGVLFPVGGIPGEPPPGALLSFRDHLRGALTGMRLAETRASPDGRVLALDFEGRETHATLLLECSPRPNLALVREAEVHALRRPHEREGTPEEWSSSAMRDDAPPRDLEVETRELVARRALATMRQRLPVLARELRGALAAARRLVSRRQEDVERLGDAARLRALADALASMLHLLRRGQDHADVRLFEDDSVHRVALEARLSPGENLRRLYSRAAKAERGVELAKAQLALARTRSADVEAALARVTLLAEALAEEAPAQADVRAAEDLARKVGALMPRRSARAAPAPGPGGGSAPRARVSLPEGLREFTSRDGLRILAGKSASSNDALTFRVARGNDVWLHARDVPGPHVVLSIPKGAEIPQESLLDAATVAHVLGKLGDEPRGEVTWARAKDVRRPKGAGPGRALVTRERVIALQVEPERVARLRLRAPEPPRG